MKKLIVIIVLMLIAVCAFAQAPDWQWAAQAGGSGYDMGYAIATDGDGNSYVTGAFYGTATFGSYSLTSSGYRNIFVAKMDATGNWLWATQAGGWHYDVCYGIVIDDDENSYVTGHFWDTATFGSYSFSTESRGDRNYQKTYSQVNIYYLGLGYTIEDPVQIDVLMTAGGTNTFEVEDMAWDISATYIF